VAAAVSRHVTPLTAGLVAAVVATVLVWIGGKVFRRRQG
jgi:hypothetical protein